MLTLLASRGFALLWSGGLISRAGDFILFVALPFYVYERTGSAMATAGMFIAETTATLLFGSAAGVFVDRWDRRRTMVAADALRALVLLALLLVRSDELLWVVYVVAFALSAVGQFFWPAQNALLPRLVANDQLIAANSLTGMSNEVTRLIAAPLGGGLLVVIGLSGVVLLDSASFLISAACIAAIVLPDPPAHGGGSRGAVPPAAPDPGQPVTPAPRVAVALSRLGRELADGLRVVRRDRLVRGVFILAAVAMLGQGIITSCIVPFVKDVLGQGSGGFGVFVAAQGVGGLAGAALLPHMAKRVSPERLAGVAGVLTGAVAILIPVVHDWLAVLALIAAAGMPAIALFVTIQSLLQGGVEDAYRGRVFGAYGTVSTIMLLVGMASAGALADRLGIVPLLVGAGALYLASGLVGLALLAGRRPPAALAESPEGLPVPLG